MTTLKTVWTNIKKKAVIKGRWHDTRHTLVTELAESGAGNQTIMDIAGHVSRQMNSFWYRVTDSLTCSGDAPGTDALSVPPSG